jgi:benzylsuccinate CoA-transferase BbsF subunit
MAHFKPAHPEPVLPRERAFTGLRVADFAWVGVGPIISKALADHGATVVHVESSTAPDVLRLGPPFKDNVAGLDNGQFMANFNSSKLGIAANLNTDGGRRIARRLIAWADVVLESYTPGTMAKWGLDYGTISEGRPDLVMLSTCLRGQTGPERTYTGFGGQGAAIAGIHGLTGWPDRPPYGPWGAYTDFINPRYGVAALTSALVHRARTGQGQYIDLSQVEAGIHFIEPVILDYTVNGRVWGLQGHDSPYACPHGVFATEGRERYIAIAVDTPAHWQALRSLAPLDDFADASFDGLEARQAEKQPIEDRLRAWCRDQDGFALAERLRAAGVPAHMVLRPSDLYNDAQLAHRQFFVTLNHTNMGPTPYDGHVTRFSATPGLLSKAAPCLGEDTQVVLREFLGYSDDDIAEFAAAGALT